MDVHEELLRGQAEVWQFMFAFTYSMALKSAVELRLADIMHLHGCPITLSQLASSTDSLSLLLDKSDSLVCWPHIYGVLINLFLSLLCQELTRLVRIFPTLHAS